MGVGKADWLGLAGLTAMYGTAFLFIRRAVETLPPLSVAGGRIAAGAIVLALALRASGLRIPREPRLWAWFALFAVLGNALPFFLISWGQQRVTSGLAGILMAVNPLATLGLAQLLPGTADRITARRALGFALGFAGVILLVGPDVLRQLGGGASDMVRQAAVLGGALCYAANSVLVRRMPPTAPLVSSAAVLGVACVLVVPAALALDAPFARRPDAGSLLAVLWLGLVPTAAATIVYFRVIASAGPTFISLVNYPVPLVALGAGALVYAERPAPTALGALGLILAGLALGQPPRAPVTAPDLRPPAR